MVSSSISFALIVPKLSSEKITDSALLSAVNFNGSNTTSDILIHSLPFSNDIVIFLFNRFSFKFIFKP